MMQSVRVEIGGKERTLRYGFRELRWVEEQTGFSFLTGAVGHVPVNSLSFFLVLLTAGLMRDGSPSLAEVEAMLDSLSEEDFVRVEQAMREALDKSVLSPKKAAEENPQ